MAVSKRLCALAGAVLVGSSTGAFAQHAYVGGQFIGSTSNNGGGKPLLPTDAAGVVSQGNWNVLNGMSGSASNLLDASGNMTPVTITWTADDAWTTGTTAGGAGNAKLLSGEDKTRKTATYTLGGVPAGSYDLIVYTVNDVHNVGSFTAGGSTIFNQDQTGGDWNANPVFVAGNYSNAADAASHSPTNYVEFTNVSPDATGALTFTHNFAQAVGSDTVALNGFQLVQVPEPATVGLFVAGAGGLLGRRRRA